jgi:hypothetical protein
MKPSHYEIEQEYMKILVACYGVAFHSFKINKRSLCILYCWKSKVIFMELHYSTKRQQNDEGCTEVTDESLLEHMLWSCDASEELITHIPHMLQHTAVRDELNKSDKDSSQVVVKNIQGIKDMVFDCSRPEAMHKISQVMHCFSSNANAH